MADITITQAHQLDPAAARAAADQVAAKLAAEFELACSWQDQVLSFSRSGVSGTLSLEPQLARMELSLGFPYGLMASQIRGKIEDKMRRVFTAA